MLLVGEAMLCYNNHIDEDSNTEADVLAMWARALEEYPPNASVQSSSTARNWSTTGANYVEVVWVIIKFREDDSDSEFKVMKCERHMNSVRSERNDLNKDIIQRIL